MINIYFQEDVPLHPYIEPYSVVYWILFNRILKYIQSYTESPPVHHTDSQGNTNTGFYIHLSLHIYGTAHPTIASNRASALHDNTTYHYKPESRPPNRIRCGMQGSVYPKLPAPCRRQTDTACLHDARHENYRIPSTIHVHLSYRYGVPNPPPPCWWSGCLLPLPE